jgi:di/tricarboxylate transporter
MIGLKWCGSAAAAAMSDYSAMAIVMLTIVYFVVHYMFASLTADTPTLLAVLLTTSCMRDSKEVFGQKHNRDCHHRV